MSAWRLDLRERPTMPALAWVAKIRADSVEVDHGSSVRHDGNAFFEGTWAGSPELRSVPSASTVFGSGIVAVDEGLLLVPPSHHLEGIYEARLGDALIVSNSFVGLLVATGLELDPAFDYPTLFLGASRLCWLIDERGADGSLGLLHAQHQIPTLGQPITLRAYENALVAHDLSVSEVRKPRERPFSSFADYHLRIVAATRSLIDNGRPYEPVVALSSGYDSSAVAAVAAQAGCKRSVGFRTARPSPVDGTVADSGATVAAALGLEHEEVERLAYRDRSDMVEAEFLCAGMAAEDVYFAGLEPLLSRTILFSGYWAGVEWAMAERDAWRHVEPVTTAGADLGEFRLRVDFAHIPLPAFGAARTLDAPNLLDRGEMDPFRVGGRYDRPIARRLAEEGGVPRGSFADAKRAANVLLPQAGLAAFTPASRDAVERYAAAQDVRLALQQRRRFSRYERGALRVSRRLGLTPLATSLVRRRAHRIHFEPATGAALLRWAVSVVADRYRDVERVY